MQKKFIAIIRDLFIVGGARIWLLYIVVLFVIIAPAVSIRLTNYDKLKNNLNTLTTTKRTDFVSSVAGTVSDRLDQVSQYTLSLAAQPKVRDLVAAGKWQDAIDIISVDRQIAKDGYDDRIFLTDAQGVLQADVPKLPGVQGKNFSFRPWYTSVISTGHVFVSPAYQRAATPQLNVVSVSAPVMSADNQIIGLLGTQITLDHFQGLLQKYALANGEKMSFIDQQGQIVAQSQRSAQDPLLDQSSNPSVKEVLQGHSGVIQSQFNATEPQLVAFAPISKYGWGVIVEQPLAQALATDNQTLSRFLQLEVLGSIWNFIILLCMLLTIHRLVQYVFAKEKQSSVVPSKET